MNFCCLVVFARLMLCAFACCSAMPGMPPPRNASVSYACAWILVLNHSEFIFGSANIYKNALSNISTSTFQEVPIRPVRDGVNTL